MHKTIHFDVEPFHYNISYINDLVGGDVIHIEAIHSKNYLTWFTIASDSQLGMIDGNKKLMDTIPPKMIFDIFSEYSNGYENKLVQIKFPTQTKSSTDDIPIELIFIAYVLDKKIEDYRIIILTAKEISYEHRVDQRIDKIEAYVNAQMYGSYSEFDARLEHIESKFLARFEKLNTKFDNLQVLLTHRDHRFSQNGIISGGDHDISKLCNSVNSPVEKIISCIDNATKNTDTDTSTVLISEPFVLVIPETQ